VRGSDGRKEDRWAERGAYAIYLAHVHESRLGQHAGQMAIEIVCEPRHSAKKSHRCSASGTSCRTEIDDVYLPAGSEHAKALVEAAGLRGRRQVMHYKRVCHAVEAPIVEGQIRGERSFEVHILTGSIGLMPCKLDYFGVTVDPRHTRSWIMALRPDRKRPGSASDVEQATARAQCQVLDEPFTERSLAHDETDEWIIERSQRAMAHGVDVFRMCIHARSSLL
jgi:hypothetical protein